jgi:hypothetical protein
MQQSCLVKGNLAPWKTIDLMALKQLHLTTLIAKLLAQGSLQSHLNFGLFHYVNSVSLVLGTST